MKKNLVLLFVAVVAISASSFATAPGAVNKQVQLSFKNDFSDATLMRWESTDNYSKATFTVHGDVMYAFYNESNGELIATSRNLKVNQLPMSLQAGLRKDMKTGWVSDLFEMSANGETTYYVTMENDREKKVYKSAGLNGWTVYSVTKK